MPRIARVTASGIPHHVTQRGNRRLKTFFSEDDYEAYKSLMSEWCVGYGVEIWAYCLMPNHVHLIAVPDDEEGLCRAIGEAHRRYTRRINFMKGWRGCLWQGRFSSYPMDETHLLTATRYVEMNPVRARLAKTAESYPWSSARAHLSGRDDRIRGTQYRTPPSPYFTRVSEFGGHNTELLLPLILQGFQALLIRVLNSGDAILNSSPPYRA